MTDIGTLVLNEVMMPVTRIYLCAGQMVIEARGSTEREAAEPGPTEVRLHAPDGSLVFVEEVDMPKCDIRHAGAVTYIFPIRMTGDRWEARGG